MALQLPVQQRVGAACRASGQRAWGVPRTVLGRRSVQGLPVWVARVKSESDVEEGAVGAFCSLDEAGKRIRKRSVGEMEQEFLEALSAWYFDGKPKLNDAEFDALKQELLWNGSKVAILDSDELLFLEASQAYAKGKPIMSDEDYNALKQELKSKASVVAAEGPRCSIRSKKMYADLTPDYWRMLALNVPAALLVLAAVFGLDYISGFALTQAIEAPPPYGVLLLWGLLLPTTFVLATSITNVAFKDGLVVKGPCPNCGAENFSYFGEVMTVGGNRGQNSSDCVSCGAGLTFDENKRIVVVSETAEEKAKVRAAAAAKKAAAAAKKKARAAAAASSGTDGA